MIAYSFIIDGSIEGVASQVFDVSAFQYCEGHLCCKPSAIVTGCIVAIESNDISNLIVQADHIGCDATSATEFETWLTVNGVDPVLANQIANSSDVHAEMKTFIEGQ